MRSNNNLWVVILAAGEGKRVKDLTRDRWGRPAPKQYALIDSRRTLLDVTLERAKKIAPPERIVTVVAAQHRRWWASEPAQLPPGYVIVQPENRGTAAGILLPLLWITRRDPDARLVILPSDHGVSSEETLHAAITDAASCTACSQAGMVLLGVRPERPETDYGWIVPRPGGNARLRPVASFREKPDPATAAALLKEGGLLNSFILIAGGRCLLDLFQTVLPELWRAFQPMLDGASNGSWTEQDLVRYYRSVPNLDFSKDLLERSAESLWVHTVPACGWLDLGTPERLTGHLLAQRRQRWPGPKATPAIPSSSRTLGRTRPVVGAAAHHLA